MPTANDGIHICIRTLTLFRDLQSKFTAAECLICLGEGGRGAGGVSINNPQHLIEFRSRFLFIRFLFQYSQFENIYGKSSAAEFLKNELWHTSKSNKARPLSINSSSARFFCVLKISSLASRSIAVQKVL